MKNQQQKIITTLKHLSWLCLFFTLSSFAQDESNFALDDGASSLDYSAGNKDKGSLQKKRDIWVQDQELSHLGLWVYSNSSTKTSKSDTNTSPFLLARKAEKPKIHTVAEQTYINAYNRIWIMALLLIIAGSIMAIYQQSLSSFRQKQI